MRKLAVAVLMFTAIWWPVLPSSAGSELVPGVSFHIWKQPGSSARIFGVELEPAAIGRLHVVPANHAMAGGGQTVEQICNGCVAAVNGDFFAAGQALGGVISDGKLMQTPSSVHDQLLLDPPRAVPASPADGWPVTVTGAPGTLQADAVNRPGGGNQVVLFTPAYGAATPPCGCPQLILTTDPNLNGRIGMEVPAHVAGYTREQVSLWPSRMVLAGYGAAGSVLGRWWQAGLPAGFQLVVRLAAPAAQSLGGHPILIQNGRPWPYDPAQRHRDPFLYRPEPRTAVAWDAAGRLWLVTADGRQGRAGPGLTADQLIGFLSQTLHAVGAFQLDGGGSATMVVGGHTVNRPSDGHARRVANALVVAALPAPSVKPRPAVLASKPLTPPHSKAWPRFDAVILKRVPMPSALPPARQVLVSSAGKQPWGSWSLLPWLLASAVCSRRAWWHALRF